MVSFYKSKIATYLKCLFLISFSLLFCTTIFSQSIFTSTLNSTGDTKKLSATSPRFPNYFFEWSVGESTIITTNTAGNFQVTHGLLQGYLLIDPMVPENGIWFPDEIKIYPNPVVTDFTLELLSSVKGVVEFSLLDTKGATIFRRSINYQGTGQTERFNIGYLPFGYYLLRVTMKGFPESGGYLIKQGGFKIIKTR
jgi:hypothetical protein